MHKIERLDILYQFYIINQMAQLSEQAKQLYQERIETQAETNKAISGLIFEARNDPKKYLPYGPILMNIYNKQLIDANTSALISTIEESKRDYCLKKCNGKDSCNSVCEKFFTWSVTYALDHFQKVHKYAYAPTINEEEE